MKKIAVFASGFGSNFEAIIEAIENQTLKAEIVLLVSDKPNCYALERAHQHCIETFTFNPKEYQSKKEYEVLIAQQLEKKEVSLIVLAGYMRLIGDILLEKYSNKIINIHPALLPAFPGTHAIEKAYEYGVKIFGITIHYVDAGIDTGNIIEQTCFKIKENETLEEVERRVHTLEHQSYPIIIEKVLNQLV
ncbi:MAG: phosphoribosylglycinamide formyltransferase [Bacteroidales bacterium]